MVIVCVCVCVCEGVNNKRIQDELTVPQQMNMALHCLNTVPFSICPILYLELNLNNNVRTDGLY